MKIGKLFTPIAAVLASSLVVAPAYANDNEDSGRMGGKDYEKNLQVIFNQVDQDGNGSLSLEEVKDFAKFMHVMKSMMHHGYHHKDHGEMGKDSPHKYHHHKGKD